MLKRTKMGGEIHIAQASMLSTRACFRAVNPTSTYCKGKLRTRYLLRHFKYLHSRESQGKKGKPSVFPDLLVPEGCFAAECHRSSPREVLVRASGRVPPRFHVLRSRHAEQADSVHAQVTGKGNALVMFKVVGLVGCTDTWPCREDAQRSKRRNRLQKLHKRLHERQRVSLTGCFLRLEWAAGSVALLLLLWLNKFFKPSSIVRRGFRRFFSIRRITAYSRSAAGNQNFSFRLQLWVLVQLTKDEEDADDEVEVDRIESGRYRGLLPAIQQTSLLTSSQSQTARLRIYFCKYSRA